MDTITRKQEALALLEKIDPNDRDYLAQDKFCFHLNLWTAELAGYTIKEDIGGWRVSDPGEDNDEFVSFLTDAIPSYTHSADACLTLFPQDKYVVFMQRNPNACIVVVYLAADVLSGKRESLASVECTTLPIALLKARWGLQP